MKKHHRGLLFFILAFSFSGGVVSSVGAERFIKEVLPNGLTIILRKIDNSPVIAFNTWFRVGSRDEKSRDSGVAHLLERVINKGTRLNPPGEMERQIKLMGAHSTSFTSYDYTSFSIVSAKGYFKKILELQSDALMNFSLDKEEFEFEKNVVIKEILDLENNPVEYLYKKLCQISFRGHPYQRAILGSEESVKRLTKKKVVSFYHKWYTPDNCAIVVAGDFDPEAVLEKITKTFSRWANPRTGKKKRVRVSPSAPKKILQKKEESFTLYGDVDSCHLNLAYRVPGIDSSDLFALDLLEKILSSGSSSRLHRAFIRNNLLAYQVKCTYYPRKLDSLFHFNVEMKPSKMRLVKETLTQEIAKLKSHEVSDSELNRAKKIILANEIFQNETSQQQAENIGEYWAYDQLSLVENYLHEINQVTRKDLLRVAKKYFTDKRTIRAIYLPESLKKTKTTRLILKNEMKTIFREVHNNPMVSLVMYIDAGSRYEPKTKIGLANLTQELLFKGTKTRTADQISQQFESLGTVMFGHSSPSFLSVGFTCLAANFDESFALFYDCLTHPVFPEKELQQQRERILLEIKEGENSHWKSSLRAILHGLYPVHPFGEPVIGYRDTINSLTRADVEHYYKKYFHPGAYTVAIVGDLFFEDEVKPTLMRSFGKLPVQEIFLPKVPAPKKVEGFKQILIRRERSPAIAIYANHAIPVTHRDIPALQIVNAILSGSQYSRLFVSLKEGMSLVYDTGTVLAAGMDTGYFLAYIMTSSEKLNVASKALKDELEKLRDSSVTLQEIEEAKKYLLGSQVLRNDSIEGQAKSLGRSEFLGLGFDYSTKLSKRISQVTEEDLRRVIQEYILPPNHIYGVTIMGDKKNEK